jgi:lipid-binding SYLF domain-containing protein
MRLKYVVLSTSIAAAVASVAVRADVARLRAAETVLTEMAGSGDKGIPLDLLTQAKCIVIVPGVKKGAIGVGGQYGRGYMSCRKAGAHEWSAPGGVRIEGGSVGFQIGGAETDLILVVRNDSGADRLLSSKFTVGADASVAAGPIGRQAAAQTDATMRAEMLAWSHSRGVFAGVALQGATLRDDSDENLNLYGKELTNKQIVRGDTKTPPSAESLMNALSKY